MRKWFASGLLTISVTGGLSAQEIVLPPDIPSIPPPPVAPTIPNGPPQRPPIDVPPSLPPVPVIEAAPKSLVPVAPPIPPAPPIPSAPAVPAIQFDEPKSSSTNLILGSGQAPPSNPLSHPPSVPNPPSPPVLPNPPMGSSPAPNPSAPNPAGSGQQAPMIDFSKIPSSSGTGTPPAYDITQPLPNLGGTQPLPTTATEGGNGSFFAGTFGPPGSHCFWVHSEALFFWLPRRPVSTPLLTIGEAGTPRGAVGVRGTVPALGELDLKTGTFYGSRIRLGGYLDERHIFGLEGSFFLVGRNNFYFGVASDNNGSPGYYRPVRLEGLGERAYPVSVPGEIAGRFDLNASTQFYGGEVNLVSTVAEFDGMNFTAIAGFRSLRLEESLTIATQQRELKTGFLRYRGAAIPSGSRIDILDEFDAQSTFYGGQLGLGWSYIEGRWSIALRGTVALGWTNQQLRIHGHTELIPPAGGPQVTTGGILAQTTNIGEYERDRFAVSPEASVNIGFDVTSWARLTAGYNFWYISRVVRPGYQIDRRIAGGRVPTDNNFGTGALSDKPAPLFVNSFFWGQGLALGLELHW